MGLPFRLEATAGGEAGRPHALLPSAPTLRPLSLRTAKGRISRIPAFPSHPARERASSPPALYFHSRASRPLGRILGFVSLFSTSNRNIDYNKSGFKGKLEEIILHFGFVQWPQKKRRRIAPPPEGEVVDSGPYPPRPILIVAKGP